MDPSERKPRLVKRVANLRRSSSFSHLLRVCLIREEDFLYIFEEKRSDSKSLSWLIYDSRRPNYKGGIFCVRREKKLSFHFYFLSY